MIATPIVTPSARWRLYDHTIDRKRPHVLLLTDFKKTTDGLPTMRLRTGHDDSLSMVFEGDRHILKSYWDREGIDHDGRVRRLVCRILGQGWAVEWSDPRPKNSIGQARDWVRYADDNKIAVWTGLDKPETIDTLFTALAQIATNNADRLPEYDECQDTPSGPDAWFHAEWPKSEGYRRETPTDCPCCGKAYRMRAPFFRHVIACWSPLPIGRITPTPNTPALSRQANI